MRCFQTALSVSNAAKAALPLLLLILMCVPASATLRSAGGNFQYVQTENSGPFMIGQLSFSSSAPDYSCGYVGKRYVSFAFNDCWTATASFGGKSFTFSPGKTIQINDFLSATYSSGEGQAVFSDSGEYLNMKGWSNTFTFAFTNPDVLSLSTGDSFKIVKLNDFATARISVNNKMTIFDGGFIVASDRAILQGKTEELISRSVDSFDLTLPSGVLGSNQVQVFAAVKLGDAEFIDDKPVTINYNVVPNMASVSSTSTSCSESSDCPSGYSCNVFSGNGVTAKLCSKENGSVVLPGGGISAFWVIIIILVIIGTFVFLRRRN